MSPRTGSVRADDRGGCESGLASTSARTVTTRACRPAVIAMCPTGRSRSRTDHRERRCRWHPGRSRSRSCTDRGSRRSRSETADPSARQRLCAAATRATATCQRCSASGAHPRKLTARISMGCDRIHSAVVAISSDDGEPRRGREHRPGRLIALRDRLHHGQRSGRAEHHASELNRKHRTRLQPDPAPERTAEQRAAERIDDRALRDGHDRQHSSEQVEAVVRHPDAEPDRDQRIRISRSIVAAQRRARLGANARVTAPAPDEQQPPGRTSKPDDEDDRRERATRIARQSSRRAAARRA